MSHAVLSETLGSVEAFPDSDQLYIMRIDQGQVADGEISVPRAEMFDPSSVPFGATYIEDPENPANTGTVFKEHRFAGMLALDVCITGEKTETPYVLHFPDTHPDVAIGFVSGAKPGGEYSLRALGKGKDFSYSRRLVSPYALAVNGDVRYGFDGEQVAPTCVIVDRIYDWEGLDRPVVLREEGEMVIYECNVRATSNLTTIDEKKRGTYAAMAEDVVIDDLVAQGVTAVEFMPTQHAVEDEKFLKERETMLETEGLGKIELKNVWGYSTLAFMAPDSKLSSSEVLGGQVREFKDMVKAMHRKSIAVIMDVVYNHTAESGDSAEHLSFGGLGWDIYKKVGNFTNNYSGCGPDTDLTNPDFLQYTLDSLEYWVVEMGVDGFRFDLTSTLAREGYNGERVEPDGIFMQALSNKIKELEEKTGKPIFLAFEGWDIGHCDPYVFSNRGHSWSGYFRDITRKFAKGEANIEDLSTILSGSFWQYLNSKYLPVNFVNVHDGFTMEDTVTYDRKRNDKNGEKNKDGSDANDSSGHGHDGPTDDVDILNRRDRAKRAMFAIQILARGIPMWVYGDERSRTQEGNNNAWCQKDLIRMDWAELTGRKKNFYDFRVEGAKFRSESKTLQRARQLGESVVWLTGDGQYMTDYNWKHHRILGMFREGAAQPDTGEEDGETILSYLNASTFRLKFKLPHLFGLEGEYEQVFNSGTGEIQNRPALQFGSSVIETAQGKKRIITLERKLIHTGDEVDIEETSVIALRKVASRVDYGNSQPKLNWQLGAHVSEVFGPEQESLIAA